MITYSDSGGNGERLHQVSSLEINYDVQHSCRDCHVGASIDESFESATDKMNISEADQK